MEFLPLLLVVAQVFATVPALGQTGGVLFGNLRGSPTRGQRASHSAGPSRSGEPPSRRAERMGILNELAPRLGEARSCESISDTIPDRVHLNTLRITSMVSHPSTMTPKTPEQIAALLGNQLGEVVGSPSWLGTVKVATLNGETTIILMEIVAALWGSIIARQRLDRKGLWVPVVRFQLPATVETWARVAFFVFDGLNRYTMTSMDGLAYVLYFVDIRDQFDTAEKAAEALNSGEVKFGAAEFSQHGRALGLGRKALARPVPPRLRLVFK